MYYVVSEGLRLAKASQLTEVVRGVRLQEGKRLQRDKLNVLNKVRLCSCYWHEGHKERELVQTQQALQHYQVSALGEGFAQKCC